MENDSTFSGRIPTRIALALLESLRDVDTPADPIDFPESDLPLNLQRRLGLSTVVVDQIRRYEQRPSADVSATEVASLFELIGRRTDASRIFVEAGQRIARTELKTRRPPARLGTRMLPQSLRERAALRRARRIARKISPGADIRLEHKPHALIVERGLPAAAARDGTGCAVLAGALKYVFTEFRAGDYRVTHADCEAHAGGPCRWTLVEASEALAGDHGAPEAAARETTTRVATATPPDVQTNGSASNGSPNGSGGRSSSGSRVPDASEPENERETKPASRVGHVPSETSPG